MVRDVVDLFDGAGVSGSGFIGVSSSTNPIIFPKLLHGEIALYVATDLSGTQSCEFNKQVQIYNK